MFKQNKYLFGRGGRSAFLFAYVAVLLSLLIPAPVNANGCCLSAPTGYQEYYVLGYEEHVWRALLEIHDDPDPEGVGNIGSVVSLVATADYQIVYYDHWEDGYEADLLNPVQSTTEVYGDGDLSNGGTGSDVLRAGDDVTLTSDQGIGGATVITASVPVSPTRDSAYIRYDGGDRVMTSGGPVNLAHAMWPLNYSWAGGVWEVYSRQAYADTYSYRLPIGEDLYDFGGGDTGDYGDFRNVYLQLEAFEDTTVLIDNGTDTVNPTLGQGQTYFSMGYIDSTPAPSITINSGTVIHSDKPIQVGLITGADNNSDLQSRFLTVLPDQEWGADYVVPVPREESWWYDFPSEVYLSNPNDFPITIEAYDAQAQTSFVISPTAYISATVPYSQKRGGEYVPEDSAARFTSSDGVFGVIVAADTSNSTYDWGFSGVPARYLSQDYYVSWAPGNRYCPGITCTSYLNGSPVWVTPLADSTTFYVDFSPLDGVVDQIFTLDTLKQQLVFDPDNDNTGMHVWATGEFAVAWGEDPRTAEAGDPYLNLGLATLPMYEDWLDLALTLDKTAEPTILPPAGGVVTFTLVTQAYDKQLVNVDITDTLPINWTYVTSSTLVTYPDDSTENLEPTIDDQTLFWDLSTNLDLNQSLTLTFQAQIAATGVGAPAYDGFESGDYSGGKNWAGDWYEEGDDGLPNGGQVRVTTSGSPFADKYHLRIIGPSNGIYRKVDLSDFTSPALRFMRKVDSLEGDQKDEAFYLDVYDRTDWTTVLTWTAESQQGIYVGEVVDLTSYAGAPTVIRFRSGSGVQGWWFWNDYFYADEVEIYDAAAINVNQGEAIGKHEQSDALFNPSDRAYVYISSLNLVKSVSSAQAGIGDTLVYTLSCANASSAISATNVVLRDPIPVQYVTFQSASNEGAYDSASGTVTWNLGTLKPDASETVSFVVKVNDFAQDGATIENVGYVNSDQTVEVGSNEVRTQVLAPDVEFTKLGPTVAYRGALITYTLSYENVGGRQATAVTIQDTIPLSTTYVTGSLAINTGSGWITLTEASDGDQGAFISPTLVIAPGATPGIIGAGEAGQIRFSVKVDDDLPSGSLILNSATLDRELDIPRHSNTVMTRISDLLIHKAAEQAVVAPGDAISYSLTYENGSETITQTNVYLYEPIPAYTRFISGTAQGGDQVEYSWDNGATWIVTLPAVPPTPVTDIRWYDAQVLTGTQGTASFAVLVNDPLPEGATIENVAHISSTQTSQDIGAWIPSNQVKVETVDLWVEKSVSQETAQAGEPISYTISYGNHGSADIFGVQITDTVPTGAGYITGTIWGAGADDSGNPMLVWDVVTVTAGAGAQQVSYAVVLDAGLAPGLFTNTAAISSAYGIETSDPAIVTVTTSADLAVAKSGDPDMVVAGTTLTYTLVYTNSGISDAQGVTITDTLPASVTYGGLVSVVPSLFGPTPAGPPSGRLTWYTPTLPAGASGAIVFTVTVGADATGVITNSVIITSSTPDPSPSNNTAADSATVNSEADLSIGKSDDPDPVYAGSTLTYTLNINNAGPSVATVVMVTDTLPTEATYDNASGIGWNCSHVSGVVACIRLGLVVGTVPDIIIAITVPSTGGIIVNTASVVAMTPDPDATNNVTTAETLVIEMVDLHLDKAATPGTVSPGQMLTYTLTYTNQGPGTATGVIITDIVPITLTNVGYASSGAQITPTGSLSYTWQAADLAPGEGGVITISGVVDPDLISDAIFINSAIITTSATTMIVDTNPANNDDSASTTVNLPRVSFSSASYNVAEDAGAATIMVTLNASPFVTVTVDYAAKNGTAIAGDDYTAVDDTLIFAPGITSQSFTIPITDDALDENDETVQLTLSDPTRAILDTPAAATLTIADDDTAGVNVNPTTVGVAEGGVTDTYQVVLTSQPTGAVIITFNTNAQLNSIGPLTFDDTDWDIPQTVVVSAVDDPVVEETPHTSIISHTAVSGDTDYAGISVNDVTVNIADNDGAGVSINPTIVNVSEGGITGTYQVILTSQPTATVIINFSAGTQLDPILALTFDDANWDIPQTVTVIAVDDGMDESSPHTSTITHAASSSDGNYNNIAINDVTVFITDDDIAGVNVNPITATVSEGGITDTYQVALTSQPTATVAITFNTAAQLDSIAPRTFTTLTWNIPQTITVSAVDDDVAEGAHTSTITHIAASSDANYDGISINNVTANIADDDTAGVSVNPTTVAVSEGGITDTYQVVLTSQPTATVTITFNTDAQLDPIAATTFTTLTWNIAQTITVSAVDDDVDEISPHTSTIAHVAASGDPNYNGVSINDVTVNVTDNDAAGVSINPTTIGVTEGGSPGAYQVILTSQPTATVIITFNTDAQLDPIPSLTFTTLTWNITQTVTVSAVDDDMAETSPYTSTIVHTASSSDANYDGISINDVTVNITDDDTAGVNVNPTTVGVTEGGADGIYQVVLTSQPTATVIIAFNTAAQLDSIAPLTFTTLAWNIPQTVTVSAVDDDEVEGPHGSIISHTASSGDPNYNGVSIADVTINIADNDSAGVSIDPTTVNVVEGGAAGTYRVVLTEPPSATVTITFFTDAQLVPITPLTFDDTNWDTPQTVNVRAVDDDVAAGARTSTISHVAASSDSSYDGIFISDVIANIADDDIAGVSIYPTTIGVTEGGSSDTYRVVLTSRPIAAVTIDFSADAQQLDLIPALLTFDDTDWDIPKTVTVNAVDDGDVEGPHSSAIIHTASSGDANYDGISIDNVTVNIVDNDSAGVSVYPTAVSVVEGDAAGTYQVVLTEPPSDVVTIYFSTDAQIASIDSLTFDDTNWYTPQTVNVRAVDDDVAAGARTSTIAHTAASSDPNYDGIFMSDVIVNIAEDDSAGVNVIPTTINVSESGITGTYQVMLTSRPLATVTVDFSTDAQLGSISSLTFNTSNWNNPRTVTVSAVDDDVDEISPHVSIVNHTASSSDPNYDGISINGVTVNITDDDTAGVSIDPVTVNVSEGGISDTYQVALTSQPIAPVTITLATDAQLDPIAPLTFTLLTWNNPQTITVSAVDDDVAETSPHTSTISHAASSGDDKYDGFAITDVTVLITDDDSKADLAISKSGSSDPVVAGDILTYTLTYTNAGPLDAQDVVITDTLPTGVTYGGVVSSPLTTPSQMGRRLIWHAPTLAVGDANAGAIVFTVTVDTDVSGIIINNSVVITSTIPDPNLEDNSDDEQTDVVAEADLTVGKSGSSDPVVAGTVLTYTLVYTNDGPSDAQDVIIIDTLPISVTYVGVVSSLLPDPNLEGQQLTWYAPTLETGDANAGAIVFIVIADANARGIITNSVVITSSTPDPNLDDNDDDALTNVIAEADLAVGKRDSSDPVAAGVVLTYTLIYTNGGPSDAQDVVITDTLPANVTYGGMVTRSAPLAGPNQADGRLTWYTPTLAAGEGGNIVFTVTVDVDTHGIITNSAVIANAIPDPNPGDNSDDELTTVVVEADLGVSKSGSPDTVVAGVVLTYTLVYTNGGPLDALGVVITDTLPVSVTYGGMVTRSAPLADPIQTGRQLIWYTPALVVGEQDTIVFTVTVSADVSGIITNSVVITGTGYDPNPGDNDDVEQTIVVAEADLMVGKSSDPGTVAAGEVLTYTLIYANAGPSNARDIVITDTLPTGVAYGGVVMRSAPLAGPIQTGQQLAWYAPTLAAGEQDAIVFTVTVGVETRGIITNSVVITSATPDSNPGDNDDDEPTTITVEADLGVSKSGHPGTVVAGEVLTYTLVYTNGGPLDAPEVVITDTLPLNVTYGGVVTRSVPLAGPIQTGQQLTWYTPTLAAGEQGAIVFTVTAALNAGASGIITNNVIITGAMPDSNPGDNDDDEPTIVIPALTITKTMTDLNGAPLYAGDVIEYRVMVRNVSIYRYDNVNASDQAPENTTLVLGSATCTPGANCWEYIPNRVAANAGDFGPSDIGGMARAEIESLGPGDLLTLTFRVTVNEGATFIDENIAETWSDNQSGLESDPVGGGAVEPGLTINKSARDVNGTPLLVGEIVEYRIVVANTNYIYTQTNVAISDTVPVSTTLVAESVTCSPGASCGESGGVVTATIGHLAPGYGLILSFRVTVNDVSSIGGNIAAVESDNQGEQRRGPVYPSGIFKYIYLPFVMRGFEQTVRSMSPVLP